MILRHRDTEVLRFEWLEPQGVRVVSVNQAAERFQPLEFRGSPTSENLWKWLVRRIVPSHRHYIQIMLANLGLRDKNVRDLIGISKGLSLNDVFWVAQDSFRGTWSQVSLYDNPFSKVIAEMAFTGGCDRRFDREKELSTSPEFTTNGMLAKCWRRKDGAVYLYKSGTEGAANTGFEPYSEYYASQVAEAMGLAHVAYGLERFKGRLCSTCPLFTSDRYGYLPAGRVTSPERALADPRFAEVFLFDAVILNTDRHLGNFGYLVDNDSNEIVGAAPIFDNGYGLFSLALDRQGSSHDEFADLRKFTARIQPALYSEWLKFPGGLTPEMIGRVAALKGFRFKRHKYYNLSGYRLDKIEDFLQERVRKIIEFSEEADKFLLLSKNSGSVNPVNDESVALQIKENLRVDPFITYHQLSEILQIPPRTLARHVKKLREAGEIQHEGSSKKGRWKVEH